MEPRTKDISTRSKLAYLVIILVAVIFLPDPRILAALLAIQIGLWFFDRLGFSALWRTVKRLMVLFAVIVVRYAFVSIAHGADEQWRTLDLGLFAVSVNLDGVALALTMCVRVAVLVLASAWLQRSSSPGAMLHGLRRVGVPEMLAVSINATLELATGSSEKSRGSGGGKGTGGGKGKGKALADRLRVTFADIRSGRLEFLRTMIFDALKRAENFVAKSAPGLDRDVARDVAVIVAVSTVAMAMKAIQVMPGLPIAPGHKNVLIVPLFLFAAACTGSRFGGMWTGLTIGLVSVMMGFGKFGVLELAHFVVPGLLADLLYPLAASAKARALRLGAFALIGAILGLGRFAANFLVILLAGAPDLAFVLYLPMLVSQVAFGALSCFVAVVVLGFVVRDGPPEAPGTPYLGRLQDN